MSVPTRDQLEKELIAHKQREYDQQLKMMNAAQNMGMGTSMGLGAQNAAQSQPWGGPLTASTLTSQVPVKRNVVLRKRLRMEVAIEQANNGYVLTISDNSYESGDSHIATTFEDINAIINSELASRLLDKAE